MELVAEGDLAREPAAPHAVPQRVGGEGERDGGEAGPDRERAGEPSADARPRRVLHDGQRQAQHDGLGDELQGQRAEGGGGDDAGGGDPPAAEKRGPPQAERRPAGARARACRKT